MQVFFLKKYKKIFRFLTDDLFKYRKALFYKEKAFPNKQKIDILYGSEMSKNILKG